MANQYVVFQLDDELYGVEITQVRTIEKSLPLTRVPHAPNFVKGVCNLRGSVVPVMDLKKRLSLPETPDEEIDRIMIVNLGRYSVGMTIDSANDVVTIEPDDIEPSPSIISGINAEFIQGVAKVNNRLLIILDLQKILTLDQIGQLEKLN